MSEERLTNLPFEILLSLGVGYLAYLIASSGFPKDRKASDTIFEVFVYGAVAKFFGYDLTERLVLFLDFSPFAVQSFSVFGAFLVPLLLAAVWKKCLKGCFVGLLRITGVSYENFRGDAWPSIIDEPGCSWAYVIVWLTDGTILESNINSIAIEVPEKLADRSVYLDGDGNIALYVTRKTLPNGEEKNYSVKDDVIDEYNREHLTYIPASQIARIQVSRTFEN